MHEMQAIQEDMKRSHVGRKRTTDAERDFAELCILPWEEETLKIALDDLRMSCSVEKARGRDGQSDDLIDLRRASIEHCSTRWQTARNDLEASKWYIRRFTVVCQPFWFETGKALLYSKA
jgi:hypothetical protein